MIEKKPKRRMELKSKITPIAKIMLKTKIAKLWHDGDGASFSWNYLNPLSWPILILFFIGIILMSGISGFLEEKSYNGFGLSKYWKKHKNEREFIR